MKIIFYTNSAEKIVVDKTDKLEQIIELSGTLKNGANLLDPTIRVEANIEDVARINYCYIEDFRRYYYVTTCDNITNKVYDFNLHVDVLMTYKDYIKENTAIVYRNQNKFNLYLDDGMFQVYSNPNIQTIKFPNSLIGDSYVLTVAGG